MNEGRLALIVTDDCSRFFKGDTVKILKFIESVGKYYVQRLEGFICGDVKEDDIKFIEVK